MVVISAGVKFSRPSMRSTVLASTLSFKSCSLTALLYSGFIPINGISKYTNDAAIPAPAGGNSSSFLKYNEHDYDLATEGGLNTLSSGLSLNDSGTFDQMYVLLSNTVSVAGEPVTGCYIKSGDFSYNDGDF